MRERRIRVEIGRQGLGQSGVVNRRHSICCGFSSRLLSWPVGARQLVSSYVPNEQTGTDLVVLIMGERYGWSDTHSSLSPTHEEFREAVVDGKVWTCNGFAPVT